MNDTDMLPGSYPDFGWAFENLSNNNDFADVTLACEDGQHWEAHKVILAGQVLFH